MLVKKSHWSFIIIVVGYSLAFLAFLAVVLFVRLKKLDKGMSDALLLWSAAGGCVLLGTGIWAGLARYYREFPARKIFYQDKAVTLLVTSLAVFSWSAILLISMLVTAFFMFHGLAAPAIIALMVLVFIAIVELMLLGLFRKFAGAED